MPSDCAFDSSPLLSSSAPVRDYLATYSDGTAILTRIHIYIYIYIYIYIQGVSRL